VPFWGLHILRWYEATFQDQSLKKPQILQPECHISNQIQIHEQFLNNKLRDGRQIPTQSLYEIGTGESNGDVISMSDAT
jgi:hypothetical protein